MKRTDGSGVLLDVLVERLNDGVCICDLTLLDRDFARGVERRSREGAGEEGWQSQKGEERGPHIERCGIGWGGLKIVWMSLVWLE